MPDKTYQEKKEVKRPDKSDPVSESAETKKAAISVRGIKLNASSAKLGFIYAELLGPPVSKKRSR